MKFIRFSLSLAAWVRGQDNLFNFCSKQEKREKNVIETVECCSPLESLPNLKLTLVNDRRAIKDQFQCDINEMEFFRLKNISLAPMKRIRLSSSDDDDDVCCPVPMSLTLRLNFDSDFQAKNSEQKSCNVCFGSRKCYLYFRFRFDHRRWHHTPHNNNKQLRPRSVGLSCERLAASENKKCRQFFLWR